MKTIVSSIIIVFFICSCNKNESFEDYWARPYKGQKELKNESVQLDTVSIFIEGSSGIGSWIVSGESILFLDELYSTLTFFDTDYKFQKRILGRGEGPNEIQGRIVKYALRGDKLFIMGPSYDYYEVDMASDVVNRGLLNFGDDDIQLHKIINNPKPHYKAIYEVEYSVLNITYLTENEILFSITSSHPEFNAYTSKEFYEESKTLAVLDLSKNRISGIFGKFPPAYLQYNYLPYYAYAHFDRVADNEFVLTYEADSLIYHFDGIDDIAYSFGNQGSNMALNYRSVQGFEDYAGIYKMRPNYGYFTFLHYDKHLDLTFRGYHRGLDAPSDGLQIYDGIQLIHDIDVPKGFKVFGSINSKVYGYIQGPDDKNEEEIILYSFNME